MVLTMTVTGALRGRCLVLGGAVALTAMLLVGCSGSDGRRASEPTVGSNATGLAGGGVRPDDPVHDPPPITGVATVDDVVALLVNRKTAELSTKTQLVPLRCTPGDAGTGAPPCIAGERAGALVKVLPVRGCQWQFARQESVESVLDEIAASGPKLFAVHRATAELLSDFPGSEYSVVMAGWSPSLRGFRVLTSSSGIVGIDLGCKLPNPFLLTEGVAAADFVLAPLK